MRTSSTRLALCLIELAVTLFILSPARAASAQSAEECRSSARAWIARCPAQHGIEITHVECVDQSVLLRVRAGSSGPLQLDVRSRSERSFRSAGGYGVSPVGEFQDWTREPADRRKALDAVVQCLSVDATLLLPNRPQRRLGSKATPTSPKAPWVLGIALAALGALCWRWRPAWRLRAFLPPLALFISTLVIRWLLFPRAFFHQNGQGPAWVDYTLGWQALEGYGPGFPELFGIAARVGGARPDQAIFAAQALLGAVVPALVWSIARRIGARRPLSLLLALASAMDPSLGRLAQSESYYAVCIALIAAACATLVAGGIHAPVRSWRFAAAVVAAGAFIAQAARVHPVCWVPASIVPSVLLVLPGRFTRRAVQTVVAGIGVAVVVLLLAGEGMHHVLRGDFGMRSLSRAGLRWDLRFSWVLSFLAVAGACFWLGNKRKRAVIPVAVLALQLLVLRVTDPVRDVPPWIHAAYTRLYLAPLVASIAAVLAQVALTRRRAIVAATAMTALVVGYWTANWRSLLLLPTDTREALWAFEWRERLEPGSTLVYFERAGKRVNALPIYRMRVGNAAALPLAADGSLPGARDFGEGTFYYRSSLCQTLEAREACRRFETQFRLTAVETRKFPAIASLPWLPLNGEVEVGLFRLTER